MTETKETTGKQTLGLSRPGKLELKRTVESGQVRQNFSHGRSKMVQVEVRKKRTYTQGAGGRMTEVDETEHEAAPATMKVAPEIFEAADSNLTNQEKVVRARALEDARTQAVEQAGRDREKAELQAQAEAEEKAAPAADAIAEAAPDDKKTASKPAAEADSARSTANKAAEEAKRIQSEVAEAQAEEAKATHRKKPAAAAPGEKAKKLLQREEPVRPSVNKHDQQRRRAGKLTIAEALGGGAEERTRSLASVRRAREKEKQKLRQQLAEGQKVIREVVIPETITVQELANRMAERGNDVVKALMKMDVMATFAQVIDADTAELVVTEFGHKFRRVADSDVEMGLIHENADDESQLRPRAPVVTVMGHVDHGKTSLLDALRETDVASGEAGGITQHIGAYQVTMANGGQITFIDTPGHAAFTAMRARGAGVTDIVVLVVAADDGVMPQTVEAINHAKLAGVPIIVAINKMDKPGADANRVRQALLQHEVVVEEMGGDVLSVEVSAKAKTNLDKLEEAILLQAELLDIRANPNRPAHGIVIEAKVEKGRGSVATVLIQQGVLRVGDVFVAGQESGRVRALIDAQGREQKEAGPSVPIEVLGLNGTPMAGDDMIAVSDEARAREVAEFRKRQAKDVKLAAGARGSLEQMFERIKDGEANVMPVVIKSDVHGSVEAIVGALDKLATDEVRIEVLHSGVGGINESDVTLASSSNGVVIGFNVRANPQAREHAKRDGIEIRYYSIIYDVIDDLKAVLSGMLSPEIKEDILGYADIREVFKVSKVGNIAGCMVTEGQVKRGARVRLLRDDTVIHQGELSQLKRFKDDAKEVKEGYECGMAFANYQDIQVGDRIECFEVREIAREL